MIARAGSLPNLQPAMVAGICVGAGSRAMTEPLAGAVAGTWAYARL